MSRDAGKQSPWVQLRSATFHPFIYKRMIGQADRKARPGDVVNVYDKTGRFFGRGLFNPRSQIVLRMLTHGDVPVDEEFWRSRIDQAVALRRRLNLDHITDAYRLVHAEGDGLSGLIAERYADCLVFEIFALGIFQRYERLAVLIAESLGPATSLDRPGKSTPHWQTVLRADRRIEEIEGFRVPRNVPKQNAASSAPARHGSSSGWPTASAAGDANLLPPEQVVIREYGVRYRVDVAAGHKTGFFCDQRDNRRRFAQLCLDATVLDLCCYTAAFGLCAKIVGRGREVTSVDLDEAALAVARDNVNLNQTRVELVQADAFAYLRQMIANGRQYDAVVLDPPKLATSRGVYDEALRKYQDLNSLAVQVVRPGGVFLTCSCSGLVSRDAFIQAVHRAARHAGRTLQMFDQTGAAPDHPIMLNCPESAYLKALWMRVL